MKSKIRFSFCITLACSLLMVPLLFKAAPGNVRQQGGGPPTPQLVPLLSGLSNPLLVTNAHDGSNRIFIVEQTGAIKVLQPGSTTPTVFLDISSKIVFGGEQGLLGLTFHPQYWSNGRFFVNYSRMSDGEGTVSEFHVSSNPNVADPASEKILLSTPQPFTNHNGGMVEFGPDGFLYIARGDGGSANDPGNRAQNPNIFNGKMLRIDVDHPSGGKNYGIPADNPFANGVNGLPEVYAYGLRNPFRFSFDHATGKLYAGDVGQGAWEEVDIITNGANYGWRIFEGNHCTNIDPCVSTGLTFPILEYQHLVGRCAILGGYIYRGTLAALNQGLYVYGDLCTGEIFGFDGNMSTTLFNTGQSIHSFGQDEGGELYVVDGSGAVSRFGLSTACSFSLSAQSQQFTAAGGNGSFTVNDPNACTWSSVSNADWITVKTNGSGTQTQTLTYSVAANGTGSPRLGTISVAGQAFKITQDAGAANNFVGFVDHAGCDNISGWAADRNTLNSPITVSLYDGTTLLTTVTANGNRPDVGAFLGDNGLHGYMIPTPATLKNGVGHSVHVKFELSATDLNNSPATLTCGAANPLFEGFLDHAGCDTLAGWAADANQLNTSIMVSIYDGTTLLMSVLANGSRPDVGAFLGDNGLHGYSVPTPTALKDGSVHSVHVKFESTATDLTNSPASVPCGGSPRPRRPGQISWACWNMGDATLLAVGPRIPTV